MYVLVWTPNYGGVRHKLEKIGDHDAMIARLTEIYEAKYEDVDWHLYMSMGDNSKFNDDDNKLIEDYHTKLMGMQIYIDPKWYGGIDYHDVLIKDARLGKILMKYIDRLNDPVEKDSGGDYYDSLECIVQEMSRDVDKEIELQRNEL